MSSPRATIDDQPTAVDRVAFVRLALLFGCVYFVQGFAEPTQGLVAQPVRSLLKDWGQSIAAIGGFIAIVSLPWSIKPLFGLIADFVPLGRSSRRNWLIVMSAVTCGTLGWLAFHPPEAGDVRTLFWLLLAPTIGIAFTDVLADSLMVEHGQPHGWTGRLQSVQWTSLSAASILAGYLGGWLSQNNQQHVGFGICAVASGCMLGLAVCWRGSTTAPAVREKAGERSRIMWRAVVDGRVLAAAMFLFLWNFNPFSTTVQQLYVTHELQISEEFYGGTLSAMAVAWTVASAAYGLYCRRLSPRRLVQLSIVAGVATTLVYLGLQGKVSAIAIAVISGLTYMTGTLIQLDLAARVCPPAVAGTLFALLMALSNLGVSWSEAIGGRLYDDWTAAWGPHVAFDALVGLGAATTAACWLLIPWLVDVDESRSTSSRG